MYEKKCQETAEAEAAFNDAIKDTLEKTEALEKHVKTVTMTGSSEPFTLDATMARWYEAFETRVAASQPMSWKSQSTRLSECSGFAETKP